MSIFKQIGSDVELIPPEAAESLQETQADIPPVLNQATKVNVAPTQVVEVPEEAARTSPQGIRYSLLTQRPQVFREVFRRLGYTPTPAQRSIANGLDYYEVNLKELLKPDNINQLIEVMKEEGIDVNI